MVVVCVGFSLCLWCVSVFSVVLFVGECVACDVLWVVEFVLL